MVQTSSGLAGADAIAAHAAAVFRSHWGSEVSPTAVQPTAGDATQCPQLPLQHDAHGQHTSQGTDYNQPAQASETYMVSG